MKNFAELSFDKVVNIFIAENNNLYPNSIEYHDENPASIGGTYDFNEKKFYEKKPYDSWLKDGNGNWIAPVAKPEDDIDNENGTKFYVWNENKKNWEEKETS
jgi:hypothetical protein